MQKERLAHLAVASILGRMRRHAALSCGLAASSAVVAALIASNTSCSLIVRNTTATQCASDADCVAIGAAQASNVCNPNTNFCVPVNAYCTTNAQCNAANPENPSICRKSDNTCQQLFTADQACYGIMDGDQNGQPFEAHAPTTTDIQMLNDDNVILFGHMMNTTPATTLPVDPDVAVGIANEITAAWVVREAYTDLGGIPTQGSTTRPLIVVACSDQNDGNKNTVTTATHLVHDLQVPVIIGFSGTDYAYSVATSSEVLSQGTAMLLSIASSPLLRSVPNNNLLFRTAPDANTVDLSNAQLKNYIEPWIRAQNNIPPTGQIKVVLAAPSDPISQAQVSEYQHGLVFNGVSGDTNFANKNLVIVGTGSGLADTADRVAAAQTVATVAPHIVFILGEAEELGLISLYESNWDSKVAYRPWYMPSEGASAGLTAPGAFLPSNNPEAVRSRILGEGPLAAPAGPYFSTYLSYLSAYSALPGQLPKTYPTELGYINVDPMAMAIVATMAVALNQKVPAPITGADFANALMTATQPPHKTVLTMADTTFFADARTALLADGGINYNGLVGPCDFDTQGDAWTEMISICLNPNWATAGAPPFLVQNHWVDAPAPGELFDTSDQGNACYVGAVPGGCLGGVGEGAIDPTAGSPTAPGCAFGLSLDGGTGGGSTTDDGGGG